MARRKKSSANNRSLRSKSTSPKINLTQSQNESVITEPAEVPAARNPRKPVHPLLMLAPIVIALVILIAWANTSSGRNTQLGKFVNNKTSFLIAASVNGQPIWRHDLDKVLVSRYGSTTLDELINEHLIKTEAAKRGITASSQDVTAKITDLSKSLPQGLSLDDALAQQGMTRADLERQVELQLIVEKMTADVTVTDKDIADYIAANKDTLPATDEASLTAEVKDTLIRQKRSDEFKRIFDDLKKNAKVTKYL